MRPDPTRTDLSPGTRRRAKSAEASKRPPGPQQVILLGCAPAARRAYVPALRALEQAKALTVHAIVEAVESSRGICAETFPEARPLTSLDAVTAPPDALVIVATPTRFHPAQAVAAMKRGWHVWCATPFASGAHEGALMLAAAQRHERLLAVDLPARFFPAPRYLRALCRDHLLGPPLSFRIHDGDTLPASDVTRLPANKIETPDGVLADLGTHTLDLLTWLLGSASIISYADDAMGGHEANAFAELAFAEGVRGTVHLSRDWPTERLYTFVFERGVVSWSAARGDSLTLQLASAPAALRGELVTSLSAIESHATSPLLATPDQARVAQLQNIIAAIAGRDALRVPAMEAMHALPLVEECYARRTPLPQPWLTRNEAVHARALCPPMALRRS